MDDVAQYLVQSQEDGQRNVEHSAVLRYLVGLVDRLNWIAEKRTINELEIIGKLEKFAHQKVLAEFGARPYGKFVEVELAEITDSRDKKPGYYGMGIKVWVNIGGTKCANGFIVGIFGSSDPEIILSRWGQDTYIEIFPNDSDIVISTKVSKVLLTD